MKKLKAFWFKAYFDKKTGNPIGVNTRNHCVNCGVRKQVGAPIEACPPEVGGLIIADLDRELPPLVKDKKSDVIEAHVEMFFYQPDKKSKIK